MLTLILGLGSLVLSLAALQPTSQGDLRFWFLPSGAIVCAIFALRDRALGAATRVMALVGIAATAMALVILIAANASAWLPRLTGAPDAVPPVPITTAEQSVPPVSDQSELLQSAGTLVFLVKQSYTTFGNYPATLAPAAEGVIMTPAGNAPLPPGAQVVYGTTDDGFSLSVIGADGTIVVYDPVQGGVRVQ